MKHVVFAYPTFAKQVSAMRVEWPQTAPPNHHLEVGRIDWRRFPDKFPDLFLHDMDRLSSAHVTLIMSITTPDTVFEQVSVLYTLATRAPKSLRILMPYYPTGTMERVDQEGQVATAHTLAQMLSAVAPSGPGPVPLYIWDAHALQNRHYFGPNISPRFKSGVKRLNEKGRLPVDDVLVFPDDGAFKRFRVMFSFEGEVQQRYAVCRKLREGDKRQVALVEGDVRGRHAVIVDDLAHSGGTIIECKDALTRAGASRVSVFVTHAVMENNAWKKFLDAGFDKVMITDSVPEMAAKLGRRKPFEVVSLAPSMLRAVLDGFS
jgi:ribose-phosphate pyrophosphokinase